MNEEELRRGFRRLLFGVRRSWRYHERRRRFYERLQNPSTYSGVPVRHGHGCGRLGCYARGFARMALGGAGSAGVGPFGDCARVPRGPESFAAR